MDKRRGEIKQDNRGQLFGLPFGMIFSIILIMFFLVAAFIAISIFWSPAKCAFSDNAQEGLFKQNLQDSIKEIWYSQGASRAFKVDLPAKIEKICFLDTSKAARGKNSALKSEFDKLEKGNFYLYPVKKACDDFRVMKIENIDIGKITAGENPFCIDNGKEIMLEKGFNENLVSARQD